jgi:hypothetical protein
VRLSALSTLLGIALAAACFLGFAPATKANALPPQVKAANAGFLQNLPAPDGEGVICVVDSGVTPIPELEGRILGRHAKNSRSNPDDSHPRVSPVSGHGTFVAATIAGRSNGRAGGIWPQAKIVSVQVADGEYVNDWWPAVLHRCFSHPGVKVINLSFSNQSGRPSPEDEGTFNSIRTRWDANFVASAGNGGYSHINFPAALPMMFSVGACDAEGRICPISNRGRGLKILAPGDEVIASVFDGQSAILHGTSFATPVVSAILAALRAYRPDLCAEDAEVILLQSARSGPDGAYIDAEKAFRMAGLGYLVDKYRYPQGSSRTDLHDPGSAPPRSTTTRTPQNSQNQKGARDHGNGAATPGSNRQIGQSSRSTSTERTESSKIFGGIRVPESKRGSSGKSTASKSSKPGRSGLSTKTANSQVKKKPVSRTAAASKRPVVSKAHPRPKPKPIATTNSSKKRPAAAGHRRPTSAAKRRAAARRAKLKRRTAKRKAATRTSSRPGSRTTNRSRPQPARKPAAKAEATSARRPTP